MSKARPSNSVEDALDQAIGLAGKDNVAAWIGKSEGWVSACADPDNAGRNLSMADALAIDAQLIVRHLPPVFAELSVARADQHAKSASLVEASLNAIAEAEKPLPQAVRIVGRASDLLQRVQEAEGDGTIDRKEAAALVTALDKLTKVLGPLRKFLVAAQSARAAANKASR